MIKLVWEMESSVREERGYEFPAVAVEMLFLDARGKEVEVRVIFNEDSKEAVEIFTDDQREISLDCPCRSEIIRLARNEWRRKTREETIALWGWVAEGSYA